jgi:hypothetical protein
MTPRRAARRSIGVVLVAAAAASLVITALKAGH